MSITFENMDSRPLSELTAGLAYLRAVRAAHAIAYEAFKTAPTFEAKETASAISSKIFDLAKAEGEG